jgi:pimeloyl-ACP methyl ester carboxylesterase
VPIREFLGWRGHRVCVTEQGQGEPLFLVPGLGNNADMWAPFMAQFPNRRIITFDSPGTGRSSTPLFPVSVTALAMLAVAVLDNRGVACADTIGFSYGGAVAQQLAYDHRERVKRLVLAATNCGVGAHWGSFEAMSVLATPLRFHSPAYFERVAATVYGGATARDESRRLVNRDARHRLPPSHYGYALQLLGGMGWSSWPFLPHIPHETLVINGDDDPLVPLANARMLATRIPNARLEIVEQAGHLLLWDDAEKAAERIQPFVA